MHVTAVRRLTDNQHLGSEFATEWPLYDLDAKTRELLSYATKLTDSPASVEDADIAALKAAGWDDRGTWQATALTSFFNFTGRMEAASGLPPDEVPARSHLREARPDKQGVVAVRHHRERVAREADSQLV
jgi:alkylhydroperoxidase family enzyme